MALLTPPELRPSLLVLLCQYLAGRGGRDSEERTMRCLAPTSLTKEGKHVNDLKLNIRCAIELGLGILQWHGCGKGLRRSGEMVAQSHALRRAVDGLHAEEAGAEMGPIVEPLGGNTNGMYAQISTKVSAAMATAR